MKKASSYFLGNCHECLSVGFPINLLAVVAHLGESAQLSFFFTYDSKDFHMMA